MGAHCPYGLASPGNEQTHRLGTRKMTDYAKQLKQHQAAIERITEQLPELKQAADHAMQAFASNGLGRPVYPHAEVAPYEQAKAELEKHRAEAASLQRVIDWESNVKNAPATIKAARQAMNSAANEIHALEEKRSKLAGKLEEIQKSQQQELEAAQAREKEAASRYAEAMVSGDEAAERRALTELESTATALHGCRAGTAGFGAVVAALTVELDKLQECLDAAKQRLDSARSEALLAARNLWAARLDKAAHDLAMIAAHVSEAERELWGSDSMKDLRLPLLAPDGPRHLSYRDIAELREAISFEQLTAA